MTNARSNFLRRKKVLAQECKKRCNDILTSAWIHEQTKDRASSGFGALVVITRTRSLPISWSAMSTLACVHSVTAICWA